MTELEIAQGEYIKLLEDKCNKMISLASSHRYRPNSDDVLYGELLRKEIKILKDKKWQLKKNIIQYR